MVATSLQKQFDEFLQFNDTLLNDTTCENELLQFTAAQEKWRQRWNETEEKYQETRFALASSEAKQERLKVQLKMARYQLDQEMTRRVKSEKAVDHLTRQLELIRDLLKDQGMSKKNLLDTMERYEQTNNQKPSDVSFYISYTDDDSVLLPNSLYDNSRFTGNGMEESTKRHHSSSKSSSKTITKEKPPITNPLIQTEKGDMGDYTMPDSYCFVQELNAGSERTSSRKSDPKNAKTTNPDLHHSIVPGSNYLESDLKSSRLTKEVASQPESLAYNVGLPSELSTKYTAKESHSLNPKVVSCSNIVHNETKFDGYNGVKDQLHKEDSKKDMASNIDCKEGDSPENQFNVNVLSIISEEKKDSLDNIEIKKSENDDPNLKESHAATIDTSCIKDYKNQNVDEDKALISKKINEIFPNEIAETDGKCLGETYVKEPMTNDAQACNKGEKELIPPKNDETYVVTDTTRNKKVADWLLKSATSIQSSHIPTIKEPINDEEESKRENQIKTVNSAPDLQLKRPSPQLHSFVSKTAVKLELCSPCNKRIRFGNTMAKCKECKLMCHSKCMDILPVPCKPNTKTNHRREDLNGFDVSNKKPEIQINRSPDKTPEKKIVLSPVSKTPRTPQKKETIDTNCPYKPLIKRNYDPNCRNALRINGGSMRRFFNSPNR